MKGRNAAKRIALLSVLCAGALCVFVVENLFSPFPVPGAKLGLGNVFAILALIWLGGPEGIILVIIKSVLGCLITGNPGAVIYSLSAGLVSVSFSAAMIYAKREIFTLTAISVGAAVINNFVQNAVFCLVAGTVSAFYLMPYLLVTGVIGGLTVGVTSTLIIKKTPSSAFFSDASEHKGG